MTREEKLYSMTMRMLVEEAEKLGIKIDRKGSKQKVVEKMLAAEEAARVAEQEEKTAEQEEPTAVETVEEIKQEEKTEEPEQAKEKKQKVKKETLPNIVSLHNYILKTCEELGGIVFIPAKEMKFRGLKAGKHMFVKYHWTTKSVILQVRAEALGLEAPKNPANHTFNDKYIFTADTPENRDEIFRIMKTCYDWQVCRNLAREEKTKKKTA